MGEAHYPQKQSYFDRLRLGEDSVVCAVLDRDSDVRYGEAPARVLDVVSYPRGRGKRRWVLFVEKAAQAQDMPMRSFRSRVRRIVPELDRSNPRTRAVADDEKADEILRLWTVGGRPLQITLNKKKQALIHGRVMELLTVVQPRVFDKLNPAKIVELFKLGEGTPPKTGIKVAEVVGGFYSFLGFTRLATSGVIRRAITRGIQEVVFGYVGGTPETGPDGRCQVPPSRVRFGTIVAEDEIDLESGFLMMPQAIPQPEPAPGPGPAPTPPGTGPVPPAGPGAGSGPTPPVPTPPGPGPAPQKVVEFAFSADRDQVYAAWNAMANLAEMAGKVAISVRAESSDGFDRSKLQNGVLEPLREADLIE